MLVKYVGGKDVDWNRVLVKMERAKTNVPDKRRI